MITLGAGVRTKSGSWYYIEILPILGGHFHWKMKTMKGDFWVCGLKNKEGQIIPYPQITHLNMFMGGEIFYNKDLLEEPLHLLSKTSRIEEIIAFK